MKISQFVGSWIVDGMSGGAMDAVGGEDYIRERMSVFYDEWLGGIVVVIEQEGFHAGEL